MAGFLGMGEALARGRHIHVDMMISHLPQKTNEILRMAVSIICMIFTVIFCYTSAQMVYTSYDLDMVAAHAAHALVDSPAVHAHWDRGPVPAVCPPLWRIRSGLP